MQFDKGSTTFDLQDTEFYDKHELFEKIKDSHLKSPYRQERDMATMYQQMADSINGHYKL